MTRAIGGALDSRARPEDFFVEEIPEYLPAGVGPHVLATVEKRGLTTFELVRRLAIALGIRAEDIGSAGMKDRHAVTRQQLSFPPPITPEAVLALALDDIQILTAGRHGNKLRTGHLAGNRFIVVLRGLDVPIDEAVRRATATFEHFARPPGLPNGYGDQRFGADGDNAEQGRALLRGARLRIPPREQRLLISAYQSELFNRYLEQRLKDGLYHSVIMGDLLRKTDTGGIFVCADPELDGARLARGELAPTGPMFGADMRQPPEGSAAAQRESAILAEAELTLADFRRVARIAQGTRRPLGVPITAPSVEPLPDGALRLAFRLPPGSYATIVVRAITRGE